MTDVLVVDDEPAICWALREAVSDEGHTVTIAPSAEEAIRLVQAGRRPDAVILDVRLPGMNGLAAMEALREWIGTTPVIVMTAFGDLQTAVGAVGGGAFDYLLKPFELDQFISVLRRALEAGTGKSPAGAPQAVVDPFTTIIGTSPAAQQIFKQIALVATSDVNVLITGESGTGKELVARAIHRYSARSSRPFYPVCIPALNPGLVESELFGHVRGSFTGATAEREGLFQLADGGTVLLDEIADVPASVQVKLLRAVEYGEITPVGGARAKSVDVRILSATNRPLAELIAAGDFREDLYFRLGGFHIHLPPLRARREDIPALVDFFLSRVRPAAGKNLRLSPAALEECTRRDWPGNIRELKHALEYASVLAREGEIGSEHLPAETSVRSIESPSISKTIQENIAAWATQNSQSLPEGEALYEAFLKLTEPPLLEAALKYCGQNRAAAAELLGLHRSTLRGKLRDHGIS